MTGPHMNHVEARSNRRPARQYVSESHDHKPDAPSRSESRSAAKHTPGPWSKVGCVVYSEVDRFYHHPVARVGAPLDKDDNRVEEAEANARLIAAAPDMDDVCAAFSVTNEGGIVTLRSNGRTIARASSRSDTGKELLRLGRLRRTALAKAEGGAK